MAAVETTDTEISSDEVELQEAREAVKVHNRKKKKSGGFQSMGLSQAVLRGVLKKGYKVPTPIQRKCVPLIMDGSDVVAMARTGSGKTAAFLLPALEKLKSHSSVVGARVVILSPTRELALQTMKFTKELGKFTDLRTALLLGGDSMEEQFTALHGNPDILIATPGRFLHLVIEMDLKLSSVEYVVFDEADRLFEMGFSEQLREILHRLPESRQTLLFSATLPKMLVEFAKAGLKDPVLVRLDVDSKLSPQLKLSFLSVREQSKACLLLHLLREVVKPAEQTVVFVASKHHVDFLRELLSRTGFEASYIYSSLDPAARKINAAKFTTKKVNILIVTDVAARGIDIPMLDNVINYNFPSKPKLFVHRVGRVARAGRTGTAHSFVAPDEVPYLLDLHLFLGKPLTTNGEEGGVYGSIPQTVLDEEDGIIRHALETSSDLEALRRVVDNSMKQYVRSRPAPSLDSVRRAKELQPPPLHPMFKRFLSATEAQQLSLLQGIKGYKPSQTIFEVSMRAGSSAVQVMQQKRSYHGNVISRKQQKKALEEEDSKISEEGVADGLSQEQSTDNDLKVFVSLSSWQAAHQKRPRKESRAQGSGKNENYISYSASDSHSEKGLSLDVTGFNQQATGAVLDLTADDDEGLGRNKGMKKWDRKRKKFVGESGDSKSKKVKTEAGTRISASYKTNVYKEWRTKNKVDAVVVGSEESKSEMARPVSSQTKRGGRRWHTQGSEGVGSKVKGRGGGRLRTPDEVAKLRKRQQWQKFRSMPKARRRQFLKQNKRQQKQPAPRGKANRR